MVDDEEKKRNRSYRLPEQINASEKGTHTFEMSHCNAGMKFF